MGGRGAASYVERPAGACSLHPKERAAGPRERRGQAVGTGSLSRNAVSGSRHAHRRAPALAALLLASLLAGTLPVPAAGAAMTSGGAPGAEPLAAPHRTPRSEPAATPRTSVTNPTTLPAADEAAAGDPVQHPSEAYEQAMAHEHDRIAFNPGGLVRVGFTPRPSDRWPVGGKAPSSLPPGRATGREMAASKQGSRWADVGPAPASPGTDPATTAPDPAPAPAASDAPIDAPGGAAVVDASGASYTQQAQAEFDFAAASGLRRQVFGFLPYWELSGASNKLNYDVLSTIAYFSVGATSTGNLRKRESDGSTTTGWGGWTSSSMTSVINAAHQRGTRVALTISVFAWTSSQAAIQKGILGSSAARLNLARQAAAAVRDRGADGINLDFEPLASGYASEFVLFLKTLRSELNKVKAGYQVTYDTTGYIGNYPLEASVGSAAADAIFIMGYDYRTGGSGTAGSIDPLSGPSYDLTDTVRAYTARVSPSRVILGLPWYGRAWSTTSSATRSTNQSGTKFGSSTTVNYESLTDLIAQYGRRWDSVEQSPYVAYQRQNCTGTYGCVTSWRQLYYDDATSLKLRLSMVNDYGLRGAGMWALGYDGGHPELYRAFSDSFLVDKSAPQAGVQMIPGVEGDEGFVVSWAAADASTIVSYDVQVSTNGGAWATWLLGTKATSDVWLGSDGKGYAFRVRARDTKGNAGSWNVTAVYDATPTIGIGRFGRVVTDGLAYRAGPGTSATKLGAMRAGTIVAITGGPITADTYTWYEVTQPITAWGPVGFVERGVWVAVRTPTTNNVVAFRAPNSARVDAGIVGLDFGAGSGIGASSIAVANRTFSPDGDGSGDVIRLRWTNTVTMSSLALKVWTTSGSLVGSVAVPALAAGARSWDWNGHAGGVAVSDGRYVLQLVGVAGGRTYSAPSARPATSTQVSAYGITVDTTPPAVTSASATTSLLSPNGDAFLDAVRVSLATTGATRWTINVTNAGGASVRALTGSGATVTWTWTGADDAGARVPDGRYAVSLATWDVAGNRAVRSFPVIVDTTAPTLSPHAAAPIFSPDGDGTADTTSLVWTASEPSTGTARVYRGTTLIRSWSMSNRSSWSSFWNGRTAGGTPVADGIYTFKLALKDAAGNGRTATASVTVDRSAGFLRWSRWFFPQDGDTLRPTSALTWRVTRPVTTTLRVYDASGALVRQLWANRTQAAGMQGWTWNGLRADGTPAPQGRYTARLTVTSSLGTQTLERAVWATGFVVLPSASVVKPGQTFAVSISTVDPVSTRRTVTFTQPVPAGVTVNATKLADGTYRATFSAAAGSAGSGGIRVSAKDTG